MTTVEALKELFVELGGDEDDVTNLVIIPDLINAVATQAATLSLAAELPKAPTTNGTYTLQCVKSNSGAAYSWVAVNG